MYGKFIQKLRETSSSREKIAILQDACKKNGQEFLQLLEYCFSYEKVWGISSKTVEKVEKTTKWPQVSSVFALQDFIALCQKPKILRADLAEFAKKTSYEDFQFYKLILLKDLKCGVGIGLIKKVLPGLKQFLTQAANKDLNALNFALKYIVEPKLDGVRCVAYIDHGVVKLYSRNGKLISNFKAIESELLNLYGRDVSVAIDGELLCAISDFNLLMSTLYSLEPKAEIIKAVTFNTFDFLPLAEFKNQICTSPLFNRKKELKSGNLVKVVEYKEISSLDEIYEAFNDYISVGYEGIMIKALNSIYKYKRTNDWIKLKPVDDYTIVITACNEGTGKYSGKLGSFSGYYLENKKITVDVGSGLNDEQRERFWKERDSLIGRKIDIVSDGILDTGSFRFPIFKRFRDDL